MGRASNVQNLRHADGAKSSTQDSNNQRRKDKSSRIGSVDNHQKPDQDRPRIFVKLARSISCKEQHHESMAWSRGLVV
nr:hypothetical protein CFP56_73993 [Quercus suber]